jgi:MOSC domain-containing protein YiiM
MQTVNDLKSMFPQAGRLEWIGLSKERLAPVQSVETATVCEGTGLEGDHHATGRRTIRQVTLIQAEHLQVVARLLGRDSVCPEEVRRNLVVSGISLLALKDQRFQIGDVVFEGTGPCVPCSRMEHNLGPGGYNAMRGHGGITAKVISNGEIKVGDDVHRLPSDASREDGK